MLCFAIPQFPYSARHGLEWWELDPTWYLICILKALGLVWDVQVSSAVLCYAVLCCQVLSGLPLLLAGAAARWAACLTY